MTRILCIASFILGLLTVVWVGVGYLGANPLALTMTLIIGAVYGMGILEMGRFHQASSALATALERIPPKLTHLDDWLDQLPPCLRDSVRLRIEGERVGLPGPALTPYLIGLLVMLGMLGTFLGMVVTLNGAVFALEGTTDLQAMRASLAAPVKGLGLAFGTSVAGVASSAMLGLISALCRRERQQLSRRLDARIATALRGFSLVHQRQETFKALQSQSQALPAVVDQLQVLMGAMESHHRQLNERMVANQESFYRDLKNVYTDLASRVDQSLRASLTESARAAGETIVPLVEATMQGIAHQTASLQASMADTVTGQLEGLAAQVGSALSSVESACAATLARHESTSASLVGDLQQSVAAFAETFEQRSASLVSALQADLAQRDQQRWSDTARSLESMAATLQGEWQQAGAQTLAQQQQICATLARTAQDISAQAQAQAGATIGEIRQLMASAAAAPRAAAEAIAQLRQEISSRIGRDNALLEEQGRIMATLNALLDTTRQGSTEQQAAIDSLVVSATALLDRVGGQFAERVGAESTRIEDSAAQVVGSVLEISSVSEAFASAVGQFGDANEKMIGSLQRIEAALDKSMARSDEQLAYYVAQAREIIDLSIMSQKRIVEDLQQRSGAPAPRADEVG